MYDHELRNVLGNLLARVTASRLSSALSKAQPYVAEMANEAAASVSYTSLLSDVDGANKLEDEELKQTLTSVKDDVERFMDDFEFGRALERINECLVKVCFVLLTTDLLTPQI